MSAPVLVVARPLPGVVGETRRVAHLFPEVDQVTGNLTALCEARFYWADLEVLDGVSGMPCEECLMRSPGPSPALR